MPLSSQLFEGDAALEAAANHDSAHITPGARGRHVEKIQTALNILDNAGLDADGVYGPGTTNAVLNYKTKRSIINKSYQHSADNIVGKMTMAKLDEEMRAYETTPPARIEFILLSPQANRHKAYPRLTFQLTASNTLVAAPTPHVLPTEAVTIEPGQTAEIEVKNGNGYHLTLTSANYAYSPNAVLIVPGFNDPVTHCQINADSVRIKVKGMKWGTAILFAQHFNAGPKYTEQLVVNVRDPRQNNFHPTKAHHHPPVDEPEGWKRVCSEAASDSGDTLLLRGLALANASPPAVVGIARPALALTPMARWHFDYYLSGKGGVVNEDDNLRRWIEGDSKARGVIAREIKKMKHFNQSSVHVQFEFTRDMFNDMDAFSSYGTIDFLDVEADFITGRVEIWFEDTYEWHPPYTGYGCPEKKPRGTHFGHAALVQMKTRGAQDFQMRGKAAFPMTIFPGL